MLLASLLIEQKKIFLKKFIASDNIVLRIIRKLF